MQFLQLTLPTVAENLALDEALLNEAEGSLVSRETIRVWEVPQHAVVLGRASRLAEEVNLAACEALGIPVLRRCSGGCAVVLGSGCLLFSVVLGYERRPELQAIDEAHRYVLGCVMQSLKACLSDVALQGTSDLTWQERKFSGNSLRCKRRHLLYHGTILYDFDLTLLNRLLLTPPREPTYRQRRTHGDFVTNIAIDRATLVQNMPLAFGANEDRHDLPETLIHQLMNEKYGRAAWHFER